MTGIHIKGVSKKFGGLTVLENVDLEIRKGELMALLGPSGSGKTTLLRIIAGLEHHDSGSVTLEDMEVTGRDVNDRNVGFVFQHYSLFRHMTVFENVAFGLSVRPRRTRPSKEQIREKVSELLKLIGLEQYALHYPDQLSGGQRQRVALARVLAIEPRTLLLDEPFGALDAKVRKELRRWLRRLHDRIQLTSVFVTHDQEEALEVADRVAIMNQGKIEQVGTPDEIYHSPASPYVLQFLGDVNLFFGRVEDHEMVIMSTSMVAAKPRDRRNDRMEQIYVRPQHLDIHTRPVGKYGLRGTITHINSAGPYVKVELVSQWGDTLLVHLTQTRFSQLALKKGMDIYLLPRETTAFSPDAEETREEVLFSAS
jgi:sulfate transport system ATP-binding protein